MTAPAGASPVPLSRAACGLWALVALGAALYATLLPFEFGGRSVAEAWATYRNMNLTAPGTGARQQFVSNVLLFLPLGFFLAGWLGHASRRFAPVVLAVAVAGALGLLVTATVEFLQVWLPYRFPAGADILGNFTGALVGAVAWFGLRSPLTGVAETLRQGGPRALRLALLAYAAAYVLVGLLPLDFVLSVGEWRERLGSDAWGWWTTAATCTTGFECLAMLLARLLLSVPVGLLAGLWMRHRNHSLRVALPLVAALAVAVEGANLLTWSGIAEGRSALARAAGMALGVLLVRALPLDPHRLVRTLQVLRLPLLVVAVPGYVLLLVGVNHGFGPYQLDPEAAVDRLSSLRLLPFFYHYHVAEAAALRSVALHLAMYAPVGVLVWLAQVDHAPRWPQRFRFAVLAGLSVALLVEAGKLLVVDGARPDSTTLLLAALGAGVATLAMGWLQFAIVSKPADLEPGGTVTRPDLSADEPAPPRPRTRRRWSRLFALVPGVFVLWLAAGWPVAAAPLTLGLLAYAALLAWRPQVWLLVVPALIPVLDLSLFTGPLPVQALDLVLLMTVAVVLARHESPPQPLRLPPAVRAGWFLLIGSTLLALLIAWWPWPHLGPIGIAPYLTDWDALRVARGVGWAAILLGLLRLGPEPPREAVRRWFAPGVLVGLVATLIVVLRERATYPGLLDFDSRYRISGWFTDMQVGGPSIETFLVLALPLALVWFWTRRGWVSGPAAGLLLLGTLYSVAMTYSRGGYAGLALALVLLTGLGLVAAWRSQRAVPWRATIAGGLMLVLVISLVPPLLGGFAEQRLARVAEGLEARLDHWQLTLALPGAETTSLLVGRGLGRFAPAYRDGHPEGRQPANFAFADNRLLLGPGDSVYVNQRVFPDRSKSLRLEVRSRAVTGGRLGLHLCEKPVRHSFECVSASVATPSGDAWQTFRTELDLQAMDTRPWPLRRGLVLSVAHAGGAGVIEIDAIRLLEPSGRARLRNGDFAEGGRHWYFTTDHLWPWRVENQWLEIFFEQGLLGLLAFVWLTGGAGWVLLRRALWGDALALGSVAGVGGVLVIGVFGTVLFAPAVALLFYLVLLLGVVGSAPASGSGRAILPTTASRCTETDAP